MTDCPDSETRDLLPDVVHGLLDAGARARVETHVLTCAACRAELALLQRVHGSLTRPMTLDLERISKALPAAAVASPGAPRLVQWRRAAAIAIAAIGLTALAVGQSFRESDTPGESRSVVRAEPAAPLGATQVQGGVVRPTKGGTAQIAVQGLSLAGGVAGLEDAELETLLSELDSFDAVTEAEPVELAPNVVLGDA